VRLYPRRDAGAESTVPKNLVSGQVGTGPAYIDGWGGMESREPALDDSSSVRDDERLSARWSSQRANRSWNGDFSKGL
jgi:hypothetical protein